MKSAQGTITILMSPDFYRYLTPFLTVLGGGGGSDQHWVPGSPRKYKVMPLPVTFGDPRSFQMSSSMGTSPFLSRFP